jgi:transcriptional regulator
MFMGPQAYITPAWYPGKQAHGKVVPTWNYLTVHVHGIAQARHQADWKLKMLQRLTDAQEASRPTPWQVSDAPSEYLHRLLGGIVGIEISIEQVQGKRKLSQDEDLADRLGTVCGLMHEGDCVAQTLAAWMKSSLGGGNNSLC